MTSVLKDKSFIKTILALALPIALSNLLTSLLNIVDQVMVGALPQNIADYALSAVLLVNQLVFIFQLLIFALCNTANIYVSQYWGRKQIKSIPPVVGFTLTLSLIIGIIGTIVTVSFPQVMVSLFNPKGEILALATEFMRVVGLSFIPFAISIVLTFTLRSLNKVGLALTGNLVGIVLNGILNYCLMFGAFGLPAMGLVGAAWGTVISRCVEALLIIIGVLIKKYPTIAPIKHMLSLCKETKKDFFKLFLPVLSNDIFWVLGSSVFLFVYAQMPDSENILAAMNVTQTVDKLITVTVIGLGVATSVVLGNILGTHDNEKAKDYANKASQLSIILGIVVGLLLFASAFIAPQLFQNMSEAAKIYARNILMIYFFYGVVRTVNFTLMIGVLRSGGDTTYCFIVESVTIWLIAVPLCVVGGLVFNLRVEIIVSLILIEEITKAVLLYIRMKSSKWVKNIS